MTPLRILGLLLLGLAVVTAVALGTFGWFAVGIGVMTDCTTDYSCGPGPCRPCRAPGFWLTLGGITQWVLAVGAVAFGVVARRTRRPATLALGGVALLLASVGVFAGTTALAERSYCRPGTTGYAESTCAVR